MKNKILIVVVCCVSMVCLLSGCGPVKTAVIHDYYGECSFELPFEHEITNTTDVMYFKTSCSMEQMTEVINEAGYGAKLYEDFGNTILISVLQNEMTYYFVIYDNAPENGGGFVLSDTSASIPGIFVFLAPLHILDNENTSGTRKIYGSFEDLADFYRAAGKNDVDIDAQNKTILFECEGNLPLSWKQGTIAIQYIESEQGNYLNIKPVT